MDPSPSPVLDQAVLDALNGLSDRLDYSTAALIVAVVVVVGLLAFIAVSRLHA